MKMRRGCPNNCNLPWPKCGDSNRRSDRLKQFTLGSVKRAALGSRRWFRRTHPSPRRSGRRRLRVKEVCISPHSRAQALRGRPAEVALLSSPPFGSRDGTRPLGSCLGGARRTGLWPVVAAVRVSIAFLAFTPSLSVAPRRLPASKLISRLTLAPLPFAQLFPAHACHSAGSLFLKVRQRRNKRPAKRGKTERQI